MGLVWEAQQAALMRLQLYAVMRTHEMLAEYASTARGVLMQAAGEDGLLSDGLETHLAVEGLTKAWIPVWQKWGELLEALRWNAAAIPFGTLAVMHESKLVNWEVGKLVTWESGKLGESTNLPSYQSTNLPSYQSTNLPSYQSTNLQESEPTPVFKPQLAAVLRASRERVYGDGFNLSSRIWKTDHEIREGLRRVLAEGIAKGDSAWNIAGRLEQYLAPGRECPRWARSRLYKLTKTDIASGDRKGLYTGEECAGQGVSYNALRLARNEIQIAHHMATDEILRGMPWIQQEQVRLSPAHPETDICDDVVAGGENGNGIYPVGKISLPLHPQCLCYKTAVQIPEAEFTQRMRGWVRGEGEWPEMDAYHQRMPPQPPNAGGRSWWPSLMVWIARRLAVWLWGDEPAMRAALEIAGEVVG